MTRGIEAPGADPAEVARIGLDPVAAGLPEVLADEFSRPVWAGLADGAAALYPQFTPAALVA